MTHRHDDQFGFTVLPLGRGFVQLPLVQFHAADPGDDLASCGLCGQYVWTDGDVERFLSLKPGAPRLCCICSAISQEKFAEVFPDMKINAQDIPDLRYLFN